MRSLLRRRCLRSPACDAARRWPQYVWTMRYDPENPPAPDVWKALDEHEAQRMILRHHRSPRCAHPPAPRPRLHAATHLIVENQAAMADLRQCTRVLPGA